MAAGDFTLGIPGAGASDFATTPIPSLSFVDCWTREAGVPTRGEIGYAAVAGRSTNGIPQIIGVAHDPKFIWTVAAMITQAQARQLGALARWQDREYKAQRDGALRLIDEINYVSSEPSPHSRTLLSPLTESWNGNFVYGYPVCSVILQLAEDWQQHVGRWVDSGEEAKLCSFVVLEI